MIGQQYRREDRAVFLRTVPLWGRFAIESYINPNNSYSLDQRTILNTNLQYLVNYDKTFVGKHDVSFMGGYQYEDYRYTQMNAGATNLVSNDLPLLNLGNDLTKTNSQNINTNAFQSVFARLNYAFAKKYLAEFTYRIDENSKLAPGIRTKGFASASAGWNIHMEDWFADILPVFSQFKLRASWGQLGGALGDNLGYYDYANLLSRGSALVLGDSRTTYFYQGAIPSSTLSWESIETSDIGIDLALFKNKLTFTGDYYVKYNRNMLTPQQVPGTLGIAAPLKNSGELKSWGWEADIAYRDKIGENFRYNISFNLSDNQNKLIKYSGNQVVTAGTNRLIEGLPLNTIWGYQTAGYFNSADEVANHAFQNTKTGAGDVVYVDRNGDDKITVGNGVISNPGDLIRLGTTDQRYLFGFSLGLEYKGFDFSTFIQGVGKRRYLPATQSIAPLHESWRMPLQIHADYWTPENTDALFPRAFYQGSHNYLASDKWTFNAAYARLKNIQIGYAIPEPVLRKLKISRARIFFSGQDIAVISKMGKFSKLFDPESRNGVANDYPFFGTASVGLNLNF